MCWIIKTCLQLAHFVIAIVEMHLGWMTALQGDFSFRNDIGKKALMLIFDRTNEGERQ